MLSKAVTELFAALWAVLAFFGLRAVARRYFHQVRRADVVAAFIIVAFGVGAAHGLSGRAEAPPAVAPVAALPAAATGVSPRCADQPRSSGTGTGSVDIVGEMEKSGPEAQPDRFVIDPGALLYVSGWAANADARGPAVTVCLLVDGVMQSKAVTSYGIFRPDVATAYNNGALGHTGFTLTLPARSIPARGIHRIAIEIVSTNGATEQVDSKTTFRIP